MSFSSEVKQELSSINTYSKSNLIEAELIGYLMSANIKEENEKIEFITENEFNIERIYKILFKLKIEYEPETRRKTFVAKINKPNLRNIENLETEEEKKALIRGIFLGSGSINDPTKKYHLEILSKNKDVAQYIQNILKSFNIKAKILEMNNTIYIKEGEEISKQIEENVKRGVTGLYGKGMYSGNDKLVLICAANIGDIPRIKSIAQNIDEKCFIVVANAREVLGKGFKESN